MLINNVNNDNVCLPAVEWKNTLFNNEMHRQTVKTHKSQTLAATLTTELQHPCSCQLQPSRPPYAPWPVARRVTGPPVGWAYPPGSSLAAPGS